MPYTINTKSTTFRVNGMFLIPRMGRKVLLLLLILHVVFVIVTAAVVIIIVIFDVFVTSQKMSYLEFYLSLLYNELYLYFSNS